MRRVNLAFSDTQTRMDRMYRHQRRIYDLTRRHYLLGRSHMLDDLRPPADGTILEVGCGTAYNLIEAAKRYPGRQLCGFDISTEMLASARHSVERRSPGSSISLAIGDATDFDPQAVFGVETFDRVFTSYTLSMIPDWPVVLDRMARQVAPGGTIHVVDFGDCADLPGTAKSLLYGWLGKFGVEPRQNLQDILRGVAIEHDLQATFTPLYRGYAQYGVMQKR